MTTFRTQPLDPRVASHVEATRSSGPDPHAVEAAQLRLQQCLARGNTAERPGRPRRGGWLVLAATASIAVVFTLMPLLLGERGGLAFADVQRHFQQFRTLSMRVEHSGLGKLLPAVDVVMNGHGQVRTDIAGSLTVVVDPGAGQVLMLLHDRRSAMRFPIGVEGLVPARKALKWIEELRHFKGTATAFTETRQIDGQAARGWSLAIGDARLELWADESGLPLALTIGEGGQSVLVLQFRFRFDEPVAADTFSTDVPAGYTLGLGG